MPSVPGWRSSPVLCPPSWSPAAATGKSAHPPWGRPWLARVPTDRRITVSAGASAPSRSCAQPLLGQGKTRSAPRRPCPRYSHLSPASPQVRSRGSRACGQTSADGCGIIRRIVSRSGPALSRRTSSSMTTVPPPPGSPAIIKVPPATSGHIASITLMPVSSGLGGWAAGASVSDATNPANSTASKGVRVCRPELRTVLPRGNPAISPSRGRFPAPVAERHES